MTERRSISPMKRLAIFERAGGVCHLCGQKIQVGELWEVEHRIPLALGGADDESNWSPAHKTCHAIKTKADVASAAKSKRMKAKHFGIKTSRGFRKPPEGYEYDWRQRRYVRPLPNN